MGYPSPRDCASGEGKCRLDVDCAGSWSQCTNACETANDRTWYQTTAQKGEGRACPAAQDCENGEGNCVVSVDCTGNWSQCSSLCEKSTMRKWNPITAQRGFGRACPATARDCVHNDGECRVAVVPKDIDCRGSWSQCSSDCEKSYMRRWTSLSPQQGNG